MLNDSQREALSHASEIARLFIALATAAIGFAIAQVEHGASGLRLALAFGSMCAMGVSAWQGSWVLFRIVGLLNADEGVFEKKLRCRAMSQLLLFMGGVALLAGIAVLKAIESNQ